MPAGSPKIGSHYVQNVSNAPDLTPIRWVISRSLLPFHQRLNRLQLFACI